MYQPERGRDQRLAAGEERTQGVSGGHEDAGGDGRFDEVLGDRYSQCAESKRRRVAEGEGERDGADPSERPAARDHAGPPAAAREQRSRQQQGQQEELVVGALPDVLHAEGDHAEEAAIAAARAEIDVQRLDGVGDGVALDHADLVGVVDVATGPVRAHGDDHHVGGDAIDDGVVAEVERAVPGAGRRGQHHDGLQLGVHPRRGRVARLAHRECADRGGPGPAVVARRLDVGEQVGADCRSLLVHLRLGAAAEVEAARRLDVGHGDRHQRGDRIRADVELDARRGHHVGGGGRRGQQRRAGAREDDGDGPQQPDECHLRGPRTHQLLVPP